MRASYFLFPLGIIVTSLWELIENLKFKKSSGISRVERRNQLAEVLGVCWILEKCWLFKDHQHHLGGQGTPMPPCGIYRLHTQESSPSSNWILFVLEKTIMESLLRIRIDF